MINSEATYNTSQIQFMQSNMASRCSFIERSELMDKYTYYY